MASFAEALRSSMAFCVAAAFDWPSFKLHYRYRDTFYHVTVKNNGGHEATRVTVDGADQLDKAIHLVDDRREHSAEIEIG
jgi:cyclic beta-1,2-glucan synthetase